MTTEAPTRRFIDASSEEKHSSEARQTDAPISTFLATLDSTQRSQIEIPPPEFRELPSTYDLGLDIFIHSGLFWEIPQIPWERRDFTCSRTVKSSSTTSHSTGGSHKGRTSRKKTRRRSHERKTTTTSTTSDTSWLLAMIFHRYRTIAKYLIPNSATWTSILKPSSPLQMPGSPLLIASAQLPRDLVEVKPS